MELPGIFESTILSRRHFMMSSTFIKAMHPRTSIRPDPTAIRRILDAGWVGQMKVHGHRAQIHVSANEDVPPLAYNRQGRLHVKHVPPAMARELFRLFKPPSGWTAVDAEWLKDENQLFVFDVLKRSEQVLATMTYLERYELLPQVYVSPIIKTLPLLRTVEKCMNVLASTEAWIEGLVFKSTTSSGFNDTAIIRCRKTGI